MFSPTDLLGEVLEHRELVGVYNCLAVEIPEVRTGSDPPPGLFARCKGLAQSVLSPGFTLSITPSLAIWSQAALPAAALASLAIRGLRRPLEGGWLPVSIL